MLGARMMLAATAARPIFALTVAADTSNYNVRTAFNALYGTAAAVPGIAIIVTINAGVTIDGGNSGDAFDAGTWSTPSSLVMTLVNNGSIYGSGGDAHAGAAGGGGKNAIRCNAGGLQLQIDNSNGEIFGGGGGGGAGGTGGSGISACQGGGGGGGRGKSGGKGANPSGSGNAGSAGGDGGAGKPGSGGNGGGDSFYGSKGGDGGDGGGWGGAGKNGSPGKGFTNGKSGGGSGNAIAWASNAVPVLTWLGGNNTTQVKGAVGIG